MLRQERIELLKSVQKRPLMQMDTLFYTEVFYNLFKYGKFLWKPSSTTNTMDVLVV